MFIHEKPTYILHLSKKIALGKLCFVMYILHTSLQVIEKQGAKHPSFFALHGYSRIVQDIPVKRIIGQT